MNDLDERVMPGTDGQNGQFATSSDGQAAAAPITGAPQVDSKPKGRGMLGDVLNRQDNASTMAIRHGHTGPYASPDAEDPTTERSFPLAGGQTSSTSQADATPDATDISSYDGSSVPLSSGTDSSLGGGNELPVFATLQNQRGPHITDTANRLDPHIPGEFPSDNGEDRHDHSGSAIGPAATAPSTGYGANQLPSSKNGLDYSSASEAPTPSASESPHVADPMSQVPSNQHNYGRDAAIAGGVGAAGYGAYALNKDRDTPQAGENTQPNDGAYPSSTAVEEPMSQSSPRYPYGGGAAMGSSVPSSLQRAPSSQYSQSPAPVPAEEPGSEHNYGRDAALAGGAGALGYGAYKLGRDRSDAEPATNAFGNAPVEPAVQREPDMPRSQPMEPDAPGVPYAEFPIEQAHGLNAPADLDKQRVPESQDEHNYGRNAALTGGAGAAGYGAYQYGKDRDGNPAPEDLDPQQPTEAQEEHHYGRNAALAGGAGAAGYGAYQYGKSRDTDPASNDSSNADPNTVAPQQASSSEYPTTDEEKDHNYGRDAAVVGGAGAAGAAAYGAKQYYDDKQQDHDAAHDAELEKERAKAAEKAEKQHDKDIKAAEKEQHKHEKDAEKAEKKHAKEEKAAEKEQKQHDKDDKKHAAAVAASEKEEKKHQKELEKQKHEEEKERYKQEEQRKKEEKERQKQLEKEEKEKNPSLIHKILHPGHHHGKKEDEDQTAADDNEQATAAPAAAAATSRQSNEDSRKRDEDLQQKDSHQSGHSKRDQHIKQPGDDDEEEGKEGDEGLEGPGKYQIGHAGVKTAADGKGHNRLHKEPK
ncbi:hypothetical protein MBLNU230_g1941t1 [Neophaeotheca triangularis]